MSYVYQIPGKLTVNYDPTAHAIIDSWATYFVTLAEFKEAVLVKGVAHAKLNKAQAWIVDSSKASGAFSPDINKLIADEVFPTFAKIGIKYFITVTSQSALTKLSIASYTAHAGPSGLKLVEARSAFDALAWIKQQVKVA